MYGNQLVAVQPLLVNDQFNCPCKLEVMYIIILLLQTENPYTMAITMLLDSINLGDLQNSIILLRKLQKTSQHHTQVTLFPFREEQYVYFSTYSGQFYCERVQPLTGMCRLTETLVVEFATTQFDIEAYPTLKFGYKFLVVLSVIVADIAMDSICFV